ncbi:MAG: hypothetical protein EP298_12380 [Gammaproteobacteria bacterium]|nr:MAG: hypothetical protein EP298_12380 [Gammaproteobacteria bacterium]UTW43092.1 hypothetical protein KFE69_02805 [bacterium SCSIO 12844]
MSVSTVMAHSAKLILYLALLFMFSSSLANITVAPLVLDYFAKDGNIKFVKVANKGDKKAYVSADTFLVKNPRMPNQELVKITNPRTLGILVTPRQFVLNPGETKNLQFILTQPFDQKESVYRVEIKPVSGGTKLKVLNQGDASHFMGVKIAVGYAVLCIKRPLSIKPDIRIERLSPTKIEILNDGNVSIKITKLEQCSSDGACSNLHNARIFPSGKFQTDIKENYQIKMTYKIGYEFYYLDA